MGLSVKTRRTKIRFDGVATTVEAGDFRHSQLNFLPHTQRKFNRCVSDLSEQCRFLKISVVKSIE